MKRAITIAIVLVLVLGFGYFLFKISPEQGPVAGSVDSLFSLKPTVKEPLAKPGDTVSDDHVLGKSDAKNTFVVYEDLQCPACAGFEPTLKQLPDSITDTKVVFRHFPLIGVHKNATIAALASEAASAQGKFWEFAFKLYETQVDWSTLDNPVDKFAELAQSVGVANIDQFKSDINSRKYLDRVQRDLTEGVNLQVDATPTLFLNGKKIKVSGIDEIKKQAEGLLVK